MGTTLLSFLTRVQRHPSAYINIAIFELKRPHIPVEFFEFERESKIVAFTWEPKGHRFGVIQGGYNPSINFYTIKGGPENCSRRKLSTLASTTAKFLFWSPGGRCIVIVGLAPYSGELTFYDVDLLQVLATKKTMAMNIQWDPTGRFVATRCPPFSKKENGLKIWSFQGDLLHQIRGRNLSQFSWHPKPNFSAAQQDKKLLD